MQELAQDIYTEDDDRDINTLDNLGPLRAMAGIWQSVRGKDIKPVAEGAGTQTYVERMELQPIDPQPNGPQLLYGLRYHTHIVKPGEVETYHDQVGYWLWEPATSTVMHTLTIPRGMAVLATGKAAPDARSFELVATKGGAGCGISSSTFLEYAFDTVEFRIKVTLHDDGSWTYDEDTVMKILGRDELFHHTDCNRLQKIGEPTPNPLARG